MSLTINEVKNTTNNWLESFVINLNLCPFAKREIHTDNLKLTVTTAENTDALVESITEEIDHLGKHPETETTLLIHPHVLNDFNEYNNFLTVVEELIEMLGSRGEIQVASFHPRYQFANTQFNDPENFTNRSPFPMLHFLREASVSRAIQQHPDSTMIPEENITRLRSIGKTQLESLFNDCFTQDLKSRS